MYNYKDMQVWQVSMQLCVDIHKRTQEFPQFEQYELAAHLRKTALSIASNISEGAGRKSTMDFIRFLNIANGSLSEFETQLEAAFMLGYLPEFNEYLKRIAHLSSLISGLVRSLNQKIRSMDKNETLNSYAKNCPILYYVQPGFHPFTLSPIHL
ncbi:MAG TPA: four helix bundle protein [Candidatus Cloacimonas sp.]|jgi:four helix bundle protein|nr:four helix bundle protein [Candidatus Cloacimonas sp.]MDD3734217.1 four helix bundle protein [Candidatus Cloacimonadota bacterium]MCK9158237.1 four helix bundle protein [Candidatus Cloacimonas sp.]MCK9165345.1 four helix bundle protein [Candidatus Cloacimonas sp.]HOG26709.1 four helix bundle protein [Candidatus Cloacimonas sp.]